MKKWLSMTVVLVLLLSSVSLVACSSGGADEKDTETTEQTALEPTAQSTPADTPQDQPPSGDLSWDDIPVYPGADLEGSEECAPQWADCESCELRIHVTGDSPEVVCSFYEEGMPDKGWDELVYQSYPEGSCLGTWMAGDSDPRVLMNIAQRRDDEKTVISITLGKGCP
jgi:hypothetical protein